MADALARPVTPHADVLTLESGHFNERRGYACYRPAGVRDWLLIVTLKGLGRFDHRQGRTIVQPGDFVLSPPGTYHDYGVEPSLEHWELLWVHFHPRPHWMELLNWPPLVDDVPGLMRLRLPTERDRRPIVRRFFDAHHHFGGGLPRRREDLAMNALEEVLLRLDAFNPLSAQPRVDVRVQAAVDCLCKRFHEPLTLSDLAEVAGLSVSRLAHLFRQQVGASPQQFLELQRMRRAKQLLELTGRSVEEIAAAVGYENAFYFSTRFKRHVGQSPRAYRQGKAR